MIIESKVKDPNKHGEYISKVPGIVSKHGGRYLVRGGKVTPMPGCEWKPERMINLEFPSVDQVNQRLSSPEYRAIAPLREAGAEIRAVLLEGYQREK